MRFYELYEAKLMEAVDYDSLLNPLLKVVSSSEVLRQTYAENGIDDPVNFLKNEYKSVIKDAKDSFRNLGGTQLWVMYIAKYYRSMRSSALVSLEKDQKLIAELNKMIIPNMTLKRGNPISIIDQVIIKLAHYTAFDYDPIKKYDPKTKPVDQVISELDALEKEYMDKVGEDDRLIRLQDDDKIIHDFGNGYVWIMLDRGACREEGDKMGHCGNVPSQKSGDRILSFRKIRQRGKETLYEPFMTFIYNEKTKKLGEMKGRANEKPSEKYHPYIVWLLKQDFIKGFGPRGYAPEYDFQMSDLSPDHYNEVITANPFLALVYGAKLKSIPENVLASINMPFTTDYNEIWFDKEKKKLYVNVDISRIIRKSILDTLEDSWGNYTTSSYDNDAIDSFLGDMTIDQIKELFEIFKKMLKEENIAPEIDFDYFSQMVQRNKFHDLLEEYLDEEDEPIDFEGNTVYEELTSQVRRLLDNLEIQWFERNLREKIFNNLPEIELNDFTLAPVGAMYKDSTEIESFIESDTTTIVYVSDRYIDSFYDEVYDAVYDIKKLDWRTLDTGYDYPYWSSEDVQQMVSDYGLEE